MSICYRLTLINTTSFHSVVDSFSYYSHLTKHFRSAKIFSTKKNYIPESVEGEGFFKEIFRESDICCESDKFQKYRLPLLSVYRNKVRRMTALKSSSAVYDGIWVEPWSIIASSYAKCVGWSFSFLLSQKNAKLKMQSAK